MEWLATIGVLALFTLALVWLATALGLTAKSVETGIATIARSVGIAAVSYLWARHLYDHRSAR